MAGVKITESFAQRIKSTVLRVEAEPIASSTGVIPHRFLESTHLPVFFLRHGVVYEPWYPGDSATVHMTDLLDNDLDDEVGNVFNQHGPVLPNIPVVIATRVPGCDAPILVSSQMPPILRGIATGSWWKGEDKTIQVTIGEDTTSLNVANDFSDIDSDDEYKVGVSWMNGDTNSQPIYSPGFSWRLVAAECPPPPESP